LKKYVISVATVILLSIVSLSNAQVITPFEYETVSVDLKNFELDFKEIEVILDVEVLDSTGSMEITFERDFFDSIYQEQDDEFIILVNGDQVLYDETITNSDMRVIKFNLNSGTDEVEIFGSHLKGILFTQSQDPILDVVEQNDNEQSNTINELSQQNEKLKSENKILQEENKKLDKKIFEFNNLVKVIEIQFNELNVIVSEQVEGIFELINVK